MISEISQARAIVSDFLVKNNISAKIGAPELDIRHNHWRTAILSKYSVQVGTIYVDQESGEITKRSSKIGTMKERLNWKMVDLQAIHEKKIAGKYIVSDLENKAICGDCLEELDKLPEQSAHLIFTSPPYYNARTEYSEYDDYGNYLEFIRNFIQKATRVLIDGRFFVLNIAPVLEPRISRNCASVRHALPFDIHPFFLEENFDFIEDIVWVKPEAAGWVSGRGRRFAADRKPLQYKAVPVTEYILVYRKWDGQLIDWHLRKHPDQQLVEDSKILGNYEKTNVWHIKPAHSKHHPAIFPLELAEKVISYYSFKNDVVLDPFSGIGTTGVAAKKLDRRYCLIEKEKEYLDIFTENVLKI